MFFRFYGHRVSNRVIRTTTYRSSTSSKDHSHRSVSKRTVGPCGAIDRVARIADSLAHRLFQGQSESHRRKNRLDQNPGHARRDEHPEELTPCLIVPE
ncbi:MAG: hypothetical protein CMJ59_09065 [Planctomycetaceae bacterium]|nr:hypothetical protein [Planctomycetaceae bacterium]